MFELILGHILGDYFFQTHWMATNKTKSDLIGYISCFIHCSIYTTCIISCLWFVIPSNYLILSFIGIFISHWFIDKYSLAYKYMQWKGGPDFTNPFAPIIYVMIDNTSHIVLMYAFLRYVLNIII
jgi:hypothetical protein